MKNGLAAICLGLLATGVAAQTPAPGRAVFEGRPDAPGQVVIGSNRVPASRFPCRSCHRRDGRGGGEGDAPAIDWPTLTQPAAERPAYDAAAFARLLATGFTPAGRQISRLMPRYDLDAATVSSLIAHLAAVVDEERTGILPDRIILGVPVPAERGDEARLLIQALATALAERMPPNGIHGRRIQLLPLEGPVAAILDQAQRRTAAILSPLPGLRPAGSRLTEAGVPIVFPIEAISRDEDPELVRSFYAPRERVTEMLLREAVADGCHRVGIAGVTPAQAAGLRDRLPRQVADRIAPAADPVDCFVIPDSDRNPVLPGSLRGIYVTYRGRAGLQDLIGDLRGSVVVGRHEGVALDLASARQIGAIQAHATLVAEVLLDSLARAGRDLTRSRLMAAIGDLSRPDLGVTFTRGDPTGSGRVLIQRLLQPGAAVPPGALAAPDPAMN